MSEDVTEPESPAREGGSPTRRRQRARHCAIQALYHAQMNPLPPVELVAQFRADNEFEDVDDAYFSEGVLAVMRRAEELDADFAPFADRRPDEMDPVERAILRLAIWELKERADVPWRVVIDQAVMLAKRFGATESHRFVNGVLDKAARRLRAAETGGRG
ncbi:MAG: transcription antitermination factor NusB [Pseudomonadales bacterium]|jgi:N utilization substance protein B|nr:transcription antitermination factor NusB [Pseudomonadales bacterium]